MTTKEFNYKETASLQTVKLTVNQDLLAFARTYKFNLSEILEESLITELKKCWQDFWLYENKAAISAYNQRIARHGVFSEGIRQF